MGQEISVNIYPEEGRGKGKKESVVILLMGKLRPVEGNQLVQSQRVPCDKSRSYSVPPQSSEPVRHHRSVWMRKTGFRLEGRCGKQRFRSEGHVAEWSSLDLEAGQQGRPHWATYTP